MDEVKGCLREISQVLTDSEPFISPQQTRRLLQLISSPTNDPNCLDEIVRRASSVFNRLLLELIQAHYNTKQRERDFIRLINSRGCTILDPNLTNTVIDLLMRLKKAAGQCVDTSLERSVLIKFLLKELGECGHSKRQIEKVVQTLYRCSCFQVTRSDGVPGRLKLRGDLCNGDLLRQKHDIELIKLAQSNHIRLPPESWAYLLHRSSCSDSISRMQSILDKHLTPATVDELCVSIYKANDKYKIDQYLDNLRTIQDLFESVTRGRDNNRVDTVREIMQRLTQLRHLFGIRQCREKLIRTGTSESDN